MTTLDWTSPASVWRHRIADRVAVLPHPDTIRRAIDADHGALGGSDSTIGGHTPSYREDGTPPSSTETHALSPTTIRTDGADINRAVRSLAESVRSVAIGIGLDVPGGWTWATVRTYAHDIDADEITGRCWPHLRTADAAVVALANMAHEVLPRTPNDYDTGRSSDAGERMCVSHARLGAGNGRPATNRAHRLCKLCERIVGILDRWPSVELLEIAERTYRPFDSPAFSKRLREEAQIKTRRRA